MGELAAHRCVAWCDPPVHKTLVYELTFSPGKPWGESAATLVGRRCVIEGVSAVCLALEPATEAPPYDPPPPNQPDPDAAAWLFTWKPDSLSAAYELDDVFKYGGVI